MNKEDKQELNSIKKELQSIIDELESIASGVRKNFTGIGNGTCASSITKVANQYRTVKTTLNKID